MKKALNVFFFIDEELLKKSSVDLSGSELRQLLEERAGSLINLNVCRCKNTGEFTDALEKNLVKNARSEKKAVYVLWGREPETIFCDREDIKLLMEKGRKEMGWRFVFMGSSAACGRISQKTGLAELTNIRHSADKYGVRGALRCCADIVGGLNANPA